MPSQFSFQQTLESSYTPLRIALQLQHMILSNEFQPHFMTIEELMQHNWRNKKARVDWIGN